jgi:hypothetical protein
VPGAGTTVQSGPTVNVTWSEAETGGSSLSTRSLQRESGSVITPGSCAGVGFASDGAADTGVSPRLNAGLSSGSCYRWKETLTDGAGNGATVTSPMVLVDTSAPSAPSVTASGTGVYQVAANSPIFFKSGGTGTISLTATAADAESAVSSITFDSPSAVTGWTGAPAFPNLDANSPFTQSDLWTPTAGSGTQAVTSTNGTGAIALTSLTLTADATAPTLGFTSPPAGTTVQTSTSIDVTWNETETGSGVASRSLQRQKGAEITSGSCVGVSYSNDGAADTGASPRSNTGLLAGLCYLWIQTLTDNVGNASSATTSGAVLISSVPTADAGYVSASSWPTSFDPSRYLKLTFPAYVPTGAVVAGATFRHSYHSKTAGDTTCYYFEVYDGATLLATHGSAAAPVSCNATTSYVTDTVALPEIEAAAIANAVTIVLYIRSSGGGRSVHELATLSINYSLD